MAGSKKNPVSRKKIIIAIVILFSALSIYLIKSYIHIFDYDKAREIVHKDFQRNYNVEGSGDEAAIKYAALGDSLTYGFGASNYKNTFPYIFAEKLSKKHSQIEVINLAVPGSVVEELNKKQLPKALEEKPGLATVMIGTNDIHDFTNEDVFKKSLELTVDQLKEVTAQIFLINIPYLGTKDLILPPYNTIMDFKIRNFNKIIEQVAREKRVRYVDLYSGSNAAFKQNPGLYYSTDQFHPSDSGYILWGNIIYAD